MRITKVFRLCLLFLAVAVMPHGIAQPGPGIQCPSCQVSYATADDLAEIIADQLDVDPSEVTVEEGDTPGTFLVTLPDGTQFSLAPSGPVFRHQNMVQRRLLQTREGGLQLRSRTRAEVQLRSALHREAAVLAEMLRLGWTNLYTFRQRLDIEDPDGTPYCFQPDMQLSETTPPGSLSITQNANGNLIIVHPDGIRQGLHACAHDVLQLRDRIREQLQQQLVMDTDGTFTVTLDGEQRRFRLAARLRASGQTGQPAVIEEDGRIYFRYRDGWEQEIVPVN